MNYAHKKAVLTSYRSLGDLPSFLNSIYRNIEDTYKDILKIIAKWTDSELTALCILDRQEALDYPDTNYLVVRQVDGLTDIEERIGKKLKPLEIMRLHESFIGKALMKLEPVYEDPFNAQDFIWKEVVSHLKTQKALAIPLVLPPRDGKSGNTKETMNQILGGIICFPRRRIMPAQYNKAH